MKISTTNFGANATLYTLENDHQVKLMATDLGARIVKWLVPQQEGHTNIVLGFDKGEDYQTIDSYLGSTIGRVAGRITDGKFEIDGTKYQVTTQPEQSNNTLHGGPDSFETKLWQAETFVGTDYVQIVFHYQSPDGENGFPGNMAISVTYTLNNNNEWRIDYKATTDKATLFNPTNHVYFNLTDNHEQTVHQHKMQLASDSFAVINDDVTVTGELRSVMDTPFDFRDAQPLTQIYESDYPQNTLVGGLDHPFVLREDVPVQAKLISPDEKISVEMTTTEPAVVVFSGNFGPEAPGVKKVKNFTGITLETQELPGAIEFENFGDIVLKPENTFTSTTTYKVNF
ncbi:aldose epimerase family protein [Vagococcus elongatus]|uniref:Aldose 1-epimerase n=1 Tax=Vagococcus elongatus TaxID=180344 RepID=A0A430APK2_9ENTE|nr:aldose epimerase family protein [Vagococcus elongatus]RSU09995.1 galactose-1-epimerase [Vagococcus elongatus]